ncbi:MAG: type II toxin-antitoxin system mRNA interferase toxin, RelE/StbE family [Chloroflexi bacterium]|nr:type II toxin-antitoxin system mRNA interferase toxin, RelE/StbE family [Chloroflexota bacterium]
MAKLLFRSRGLRALQERGDRSGIDSRYVRRIELILARMAQAEHVSELDVSGYRLHQLRGDLAGTWSIRVSANWRITFRVDGDTMYEIDYVDYHQR